MNKHLENTPTDLENTYSERIQSIEDTGNIIINNLTESTHGFGTFVALLSTIVWQSHRELTETWLQKVVKKEYSELLPGNENPEVEEMKDYVLGMIWGYAFDTLYRCTQNLSQWQQIKSKFLVSYTLAQSLPIHDQDRILAKEMGISYEIWQQMLGLFSHNTKFIDLLRLQDTSLEGATYTEKKWFVLVVPKWDSEQISSLWTLPGVEVINQSVGTIIINMKDERVDLYEKEIPLLFIGEEVFRRYDQIIRLGEKEALVRKTVYDRLGNIYVYKRHFGGNKKNWREPEHELAPKGV